MRGISDVLDTDATAEAHAGASWSSKARAMTKGDVSLALAGKGEAGISAWPSKFVISR